MICCYYLNLSGQVAVVDRVDQHQYPRFLKGKEWTSLIGSSGLLTIRDNIELSLRIYLGYKKRIGHLTYKRRLEADSET